MRHSLAGAALFAALLCACATPRSSSIPTGALSAGAGQTGASGSIEYPVFDPLETIGSAPSASAPSTYATAEAPYIALSVLRGISESLDIEVGVDGALYGILPVPHGGFLGVRKMAFRGTKLDIGYALRAGYSGLLASYDDLGTEASMHTGYATVSATLRYHKLRWAQPHISLAAQPVFGLPTINGERHEALIGGAASMTFGVNRSVISPFATVGYRHTNNVRGSEPFVSFGIAKSLPSLGR